MNGVSALIPEKIVGIEPGLLAFSVPLVPPSVNHYKMPRRQGGFFITKEAQAFIEAVSMIGRSAARTLPVEGKYYRVELTVYVLTKRFLRGDSDNMEKVAFDALTKAGLITDDRYITRHTHYRVPVELAAQERTEYVVIGRKEP